MTTTRQFSFAAGELAPSLYARTDTVKYQTGLRKMSNMFVMRHGGGASRPGTEFVSEVAYSEKQVRLIPFVFSSDQTYVLEFGHLYMRVHKDGFPIYEAAKNITGITNANPAVVTSAGHGYSTGDEIYITGVVGAMANYVNNRSFKVTVIGANTFSLQYMDGVTNVNSTGFGSYTSGGTCRRIYEIASPYEETDIADINYVQSADVVTLVHGDFAPRELSRFADDNWTITEISFNPTIEHPLNLGGTAATAGAITYRYKVTAVDEETGEESLPGTQSLNNITGVTQASPAVVTTSAAHGYTTGDEVYIEDIVGMTELNDRVFTITVTGATTFSLDSESSTSYTAYSSGGTVGRTFAPIASAAISTTNYIDLSWVEVAGARLYHVYQELNGVYGYIGSAEGGAFRALGAVPDISDTPPNQRNPFFGTSNYPKTVTYFQQRLGFANSDNYPETSWFSKSGNYHNFTTSAPLQDDDAVTYTIVGRQVNQIRHMIDIGQLLTLTSGGEHIIQGDTAGVLKPAEVNPKQLSYNGANTLPPIVVGSSALYVQARGSRVRYFQLDDIKGSEGDDLTIFSAHLFEDFTIVDWAFQQIPHSIVWVVRSDGTLLGLTYVKEHELVGWHQHDLGGLVENVCVVPEGNEDAVYFVVKRTIGGQTKRYIERLTQRRFTDIIDYVGMDCSLSYDGRNTGATTMTLSGSGWTYTDTLTLTASASTFKSSDVGNAVFVYDASGTEYRCNIIAYTSATVVSVKPTTTIPVSLRATATTSWSLAVDQLAGLWHIEGETVSVFADRYVVGSPNNASYETITVTNGVITLDKPYAVIHVGLPYLCDIQTLDIDTANGAPIVDKQKLVQKVTMYVEKTRGIWAGADEPTDDAVDPLEGLTELKIRSEENYDEPVDLATGPVDVIIRSEWNSNGRVFIRQVDPIPMSILAVAPAGIIPLGGR